MSSPLAFVVEDNGTLAHVYGTAVEKAGYEVEIIHEGQQALDRLAVVTPYLVVLDLHLPTIGGIQILEFIRSDERLKQIKVVVVSADDRLASSGGGCWSC